MKSAWRKMFRSIFMPLGQGLLDRRRARRRCARVSSSVLAPGCFWTPRTTARLAVERALAALERRPDRPRRPGRRAPARRRAPRRPSRRCPPASAMRPTPRMSSPARPRGRSPPRCSRSSRAARATTSSSVTPNAREPLRADHDLVLLQLAADGDDLRDAGDREQAPPDDPVAAVAQLHRRVPLRRERDEQDLAHDRRDRRERRARRRPGGSAAATSWSFSLTIWRAR